MALNSKRILLTLSFILALLSAAVPSVRVHAMTDTFQGSDLPSLEAFVEQVRDGQAGEVRGIYIPGRLAAPVVQQPAGIEEFVSPWQNIVTQFGLASRFGSTGLLAHNYLSGESFAYLHEGQEIHLIQGDGRINTFIVSEVHQYQAMNPDSTSSTFVDLESNASLTDSELFTKMYNRPGQVVFQTCIQAGNTLTWGRLFVIAEPAS